MTDEEPPFRYPEDSLAGASERLDYYGKQLVNVLLDEMVKLGVWLREHVPCFAQRVERK